MPRYRAKELCFVDNGLRHPGDVFDYNGPPNDHIERIDVVREESLEDTEQAPAVERPRRGRPPKVRTVDM